MDGDPQRERRHLLGHHGCLHCCADYRETPSWHAREAGITAAWDKRGQLSPQRATAAYRTIGARRRRLELQLERRSPKLYDARHAARGLGRALWPLLGPLLTALLVVPVLALAGLIGPLGLKAPSIDLPSLDMPHVPTPSITAPGWLQAIGEGIGAAIAVLGDAVKCIAAAVALIFGARRTRDVRRARMAAQQVGRQELLRRLAVALSGIEVTARSQGSPTIGDASAERQSSHAGSSRSGPE